MTPQTMPSGDVLVFVMALSWSVISATMLAYSLRMEDRTKAPSFWTLSFVGASMVAVVFFWRLVGGGT